MQALCSDALEWGSWHYGDWMATYEGLRASTARLIGGKASEIAIVKNTSEGIAIFANGLQWKPGDRVVAFREEFPQTTFPGCDWNSKAKFRLPGFLIWTLSK